MVDKTVERNVLTGIRPTGALHLGHYAGALVQFLEVQEDPTLDCYFLIADLQAFSTHAKESLLVAENIREVVLDWLAVGLDPTRPNVKFVHQSSIESRDGISLRFMAVTPFGRVQRNKTIQAELVKINEKAGNDGASVLFFSYLPDQYADIYMMQQVGDVRHPILVPVGADQVPHLEDAREAARTFNHLYETNLFIPCDAKVVQSGARLPGIFGGDKMSKSLGNAIFLKDTEEELWDKVKRMYTDPNRPRPSDKGTPEGLAGHVPIQYLRVFAPQEYQWQVDEFEDAYLNGGLKDMETKEYLYRVLNEKFGPIREARAYHEANTDIHEILAYGTHCARINSDAVLHYMNEAMGMLKYSPPEGYSYN